MSSPPQKYLRYFDFTQYATTNPEKPLPGASVDQEYNRLKATTDQTIDRLNLIQRDDGGLRDIIGTSNLADGAVTTPKLADGAVTNPKIADAAVGPSKIAPLAVTHSHIGVAAVDGSNIANDSINSSKIVDGSIATVDLGDGIVTSAKLAPSLALAGVPTAPTPNTGDNTTKLATTAFVAASMSAAGMITEAPNDGALYGRQALGWQLGVKLAGDVMTGPLQVPSLRLGGATAAFAGIKSNGPELQARLADDSAFAAFASANHNPGGNLLYDLGTAALRWKKLFAKDADFSGDVNVTGNITGNFPGVPNKNLLINGNMAVCQRGNQYSQGNAAAPNYALDRWKTYISMPGRQLYVSQFDAFPHWAGIAPSIAGAMGADDYAFFGQTVEAENFAEAQFGTATAKPITFSALVMAKAAGTYGVTFRSADGSRNYVGSFVHAGAYARTRISVTAPGDTVVNAVAWPNQGAGPGISVYFDLGAGANRSAPVTGAWVTANVLGLTGGFKLASVASGELYVTDCKLEIGSVATPFVADDFSENFDKCLRYYQALTVGSVWTIGNCETSTSCYAPLRFIKPLRAAPTITLPPAGTAGDGAYFTAPGGVAPSTIGSHVANAIKAGSARLDGNAYVGLGTAGLNAEFNASGGTPSIIKLDAEL